MRQIDSGLRRPVEFEGAGQAGHQLSLLQVEQARDYSRAKERVDVVKIHFLPAALLGWPGGN